MTNLISSQRYRDEGVIEVKRANKDYIVSVSPVFEFMGYQVRLVLDGHHSYEAARLDGVDPELCEQDAMDNDSIGLLDVGNIDDFLSFNYVDSDLYDIETGIDI